MRPIKFRAWHKNREEWVSISAHFGFNTEGKLYQTDFKLIELMQYTGLKDSTKWEQLTIEEKNNWIEDGGIKNTWNGKEIYESDLVENKYMKGEVVWNPTEARWGVYGKVVKRDWNDIEVVGNKYEDKKG